MGYGPGLLRSWRVASPTRGARSGPPDEIREQTIYIPYDKLRETFEKEGRGVFLPYDKFQELWKAARQQQPPPAQSKPPVQALITDIENDALVENDVVRVRAVVKIDVLGSGWIEVPLRLADVALLAAELDKQPARLVSGPDGSQTLLLHKEGQETKQVELRLEYAKGISKAPGQNSVTFQPPLAAVNRWRIRIPGAGVKVNVHPMLAATEVPAGSTEQEKPPAQEGSATPDENKPAETQGPGEANASSQTVILAFVGAAPTVRIDWTPKAEGARGLDALVSVRAEQEVIIDEAVTRTRTRLEYEISRAELPQLTIEVPADQRVVNVVDPNVRQWNVQSENETQRIVIGLFQPASSNQHVTVELEKFTEQSAELPVSVPVVRAVDAGRQLGVVAVRLADGLRAEPLRRAAISQLDAKEIPAAMADQTWAFTYRYASLPYELSLRVEKIEPRIQVDQLVEAFLEPQQLTVDLLALYDIQRTGVFELELDIPPGHEVRQVRGHAVGDAQAATVDTYALQGADNTRLKVNLGSKALGKVGLLVELQRRLEDANLLSPTGEASQLVFAPPRVALGQVQQASGRLVVYAPRACASACSSCRDCARSLLTRPTSRSRRCARIASRNCVPCRLWHLPRGTSRPPSPRCAVSRRYLPANCWSCGSSPGWRSSSPPSTSPSAIAA